MKTKGHSKLATRYKILLWLAGLFVLWQLLQKESVVDALLAFLFAGVVPGSNKVLSPNAVIQLVALILLLGGALLMIKPTIRALKRRRQWAEMKPTTAVEPMVVMPAVLRHAIEAGHVEQASQPKQRSKTMLDLSKFMQTLQPKLQRLWARCVAESSKAYALLIKNGKLAVHNLQLAWHRISPYLWKLDGWLEKHTRRFIRWLAGKTKRHDTARLLMSFAREYQQPLAKFRPSVLLADAKRDFHQFKLKANSVYDSIKKMNIPK